MSPVKSQSGVRLPSEFAATLEIFSVASPGRWNAPHGTIQVHRDIRAHSRRLVSEVRREEAERELREKPREGVVREPLTL